MQSNWGFYGRQQEEQELKRIIDRGRWFFCQISGRRRIGKTTLINRLLSKIKNKKIFYVQIPDSDPSGVLQAVNDALEDFEVPKEQYPSPTHLQGFSKLIGKMTAKDYFVFLDEFQYFHRKQLYPFCSFLQTEVDRLSADQTASGGLFVLGSIHNEMMAVLEDRRSPLFNRVSDRLIIQHFDFKTLKELWNAHDINDPYQQLFLWTLFEGIPKFYRDSFEQGVLKHSNNFRTDTLEALFFRGSSPLRIEADNWFLNEFRGRYESLLKIVSVNNGCSHSKIIDEYRHLQGGQEDHQIGGYLKSLIEKFQIVEMRLPIFATKGTSRKSRYYITDNFLLSWLGAIDRQIKTSRVRPMDICISTCSSRLEVIEGAAFEKLIRLLLEELSRSGHPDFQITKNITGYWNRSEEVDRSIEIDHISINDDQGWVNFGTCKRSADKLIGDCQKFNLHIEAFLKTKEGKALSSFKQQKVAFAPNMSMLEKERLQDLGFKSLTLKELLEKL